MNIPPIRRSNQQQTYTYITIFHRCIGIIIKFNSVHFKLKRKTFLYLVCTEITSYPYLNSPTIQNATSHFAKLTSILVLAFDGYFTVVLPFEKSMSTFMDH